jgi:hypothetical protein
MSDASKAQFVKRTCQCNRPHVSTDDCCAAQTLNLESYSIMSIGSVPGRAETFWGGVRISFICTVSCHKIPGYSLGPTSAMKIYNDIDLVVYETANAKATDDRTMDGKGFPCRIAEDCRPSFPEHEYSIFNPIESSWYSSH